MTKMTKAQLIEALNSYTGDNEWEDVIRLSGLLDEEATYEADPGHMSDIIVLTDGSVIIWDGPLGMWREA